MTEAMTAIGLGLALAALGGTAWVLLRQGEDRRRQNQALVRLETALARLADQAVAADARQRALGEQLARDVHGLRGDLVQTLERRLGEASTAETRALAELRAQTIRHLSAVRAQIQQLLAAADGRAARRESEALRRLHQTLSAGLRDLHQQVAEAVRHSGDALGQRMERLTEATDARLQDIGGQVERRLSEGFEKTTAVFADVQRRLALIDQAQQRITELSSNVVSLQEVLADKRSRGAFGEVQLAALVRNVMPESSFALQHTLPNGSRADCVLFLPPPTGHVAVDSKFPLESFQRMQDDQRPPAERRAAERQFRQDVLRHIEAIAGKYILPPTTADGAVMFIPAEAVFAEIQAHYPDVVDAAYRARVWLCSPTTLMAVLNTARAVLKDDATRQQVHIIQEHLGWLAKDFERFRRRMDNLARHIRQAHQDVAEVHVSAGKIADHFERIERVELESPEEAVRRLGRVAPPNTGMPHPSAGGE